MHNVSFDLNLVKVKVEVYSLVSTYIPCSPDFPFTPWSLGLFMPVPSQLPGEHTSPAAEGAMTFFNHIFQHYPRRYPFILLGEERQSRLSVLLKNANTTTRPGFEPATL